MSHPLQGNFHAKSGVEDIVGDAGSAPRLAAIAGVVGGKKGAHRVKTAKLEAILRHLRQALTHLGEGEADKAVVVATAALDLDERYGQSWHVLAIALEKSGHLQNALSAYEAAVQLLPDDVAVIEDLGSLAYRLGFLELAEKLYHRALAISPGNPTVVNNLACVLRDGNRYGEAVELLKAVISAEQGIPLLWNTLGTVLSDQGDIAASVIFYEEAIRLDPTFYKARYNLANIHMALGEPERALVDIDSALDGVKLPFDVATMKMAKGFTQMMLGDLAGGFETYEARFDRALPEAVVFQEFGARWAPGDELNGKTLLVYGEQGLGDEVLFANVLGDVIRAVGPQGRVLLATERRLAPLFRRSYPTLETHDHLTVSREGRTERYVAFEGDAPPIDLWTPIGSLFRGFRTAIDQFPTDPAFLKADPERVEHWRQVMQAHSPLPKVGIVWKSLNMTGVRARGFTPFDLWRPVLETRGVQFVNLQYGDCSAELEQARASGLDIWNPPGIDLKADLDDVVALSCALDLFVGPMTATTNLAAAGGVRAWVISMPDAWPRFGTDGLPCYPSVRLFPADGFGDWGGVMGRIEQALKTEIVGSGSGAVAAA